MSITIKYTKAQYQAKITELEGYYAQLEAHLSRMSELREQMYNFWDDENGQEAGLLLTEQIRSVRFTMDQVNDTLIFYKGTIEKLDGADLNVGDLIGEALSLIKTGYKVGVIIGPEGGFSDKEIELAKQTSNAHIISLGKRILRTETAAITSLSMLMLHAEMNLE